MEREKENEEEMEHAKEKEMEKKVEVPCRSGVEQSLPRGHVASAGVQTVPLRRPRRCRVNGRAVQTEAENDEPDVDASVDGKDVAAALKIQRNYRGFKGRRAAQIRTILVMLEDVHSHRTAMYQQMLDDISKMRFGLGKDAS